MEDDTFNGMFIPKGTMVFANAWYVVADVSVLLRDPDHYYLRFGYLYHTVAGPWLWTHASTTTLSYSSPNVSWTKMAKSMKMFSIHPRLRLAQVDGNWFYISIIAIIESFFFLFE